MTTPLLGTFIIGYSRATGTKPCGIAVRPRTGILLPPLPERLLHGETGRTVGQAVVKHPLTQAVGFTGSRMMESASKSKQPIRRVRIKYNSTNSG